MNPVTHIEYPRLWSVDITLASGILITLAFCLLSRPERGVCRCLCPCCLPSGTLRIRDSLLFRERPAPASPILFPSSHLRLHCGACRQCHAAPLFRLQMLTCRRALAALRALPSLATCRREACGTDSSPRTADDTTSGCTQCLSRPRASGNLFPPIRSVWQPGSSVPQSFGFAMHSTLARSSGITVHREMNEPIATFSRDRLVTARPRWRGAIAECLELEGVHGNLLFAYSLHASCIFRFSEVALPSQATGRAGVSLRYLGGISPKPHCKGLKFRTFAISSLYIIKFFLQFQSVMCVFTLILCRLRSRLVCCPGMGFRVCFMH